MNVPRGQQDLYDDLPLEVLPNDVRKSAWYSPRMDPTYYSVQPHDNPTLSSPTSFQQYLQQLPYWIQQLLDDIHWFLPEQEVHQQITGKS